MHEGQRKLASTTDSSDWTESTTDDIVDESETPNVVTDYSPLGPDIIVRTQRATVGSWCVPVRIGRGTINKVTGLIDSGAQPTIIREDVLRLVPDVYNRRRESAVRIMDVHGHTGPRIEQVTIPITIGTKTTDVDVCIADIKDPCILGMNFMHQVGAKIDFGQGILTIGHEQTILEMEETTKCARLVVRRTTVVPAHSEALVPMKTITKGTNSRHPMVVEPLKNFVNETGLAMGKTLVKCRRSGTDVVVVNPTDCPVVIEPGEPVAFASPAETILGAIPKNHSPEKLRQTPDEIRQNDVTDVSMPVLPAHLQEIVSRLDLSDERKQQCARLISEYSDCFMTPDGPLGRTDVVKHGIDVGDTRPIKQRLRRVPQMQQQIIDDEVDKMLRLDVIEPSDSPWSSPIVLVEKKNGFA